MNLPFKKSTSGLFITMYAFFAVFISSYVYADRSIPFAPAEVISPDCIPGSANCFVRATTLTGSNVVTSGTPTSVASPATLSASLTYNTSAGYPDNGYSHNYRVYAYKNTPAGRVYSPTYATLVTPQGTVGDPGNLNASLEIVLGDGYTAVGNSHNYRIYAFKDVPGGRVYSTNYATLATDFVDPNDSSTFNLNLSWDPVPGATGYRILKYVSGSLNYDQGLDVLTNSFNDTGLLFHTQGKSNAFITTSSGILDQNQSQTVYTVNVSWDAVEGADGYRVLKSNTNTNVGSGYYSGYGVIGAQNYDAGYDTTSTSLVDDACSSVCFDSLKGDVSQSSGYSNEASIQGLLTLSGPILISANGYINWGGTAGSDGYGFRDHAGVMQYKDNAGSWTSLNTLGGVSFNSLGSFIGTGSSESNHELMQSILLGYHSGLNISNESNLNFIGGNAGAYATGAHNSNFFGYQAGMTALNASNSVFIGDSAGYSATNAKKSVFIGDHAGYFDPVNNTNNEGDYSILIGPNTSTNGYSNSIAIGNAAINNRSNQFTLGSHDFPIREVVIHDWNGIGYINFANPYAATSGEGGYGIRDNNGTLEFKNSGGSWAVFGGGSSAPTLDSHNNFIVGGGEASVFNSNFIGMQAGYNATSALNSNFFGQFAGRNATSASNSNFFGNQAGLGATNASSANFLGYHAGDAATWAQASNFIGQNAGQNATSSYASNFIGAQAGYNASSAHDSNFFGNSTGNGAINANNSSFIGYYAGYSATNAANSVFIGNQAGDNDTVDNTSSGFSILLGPSTSTGGFSNSIAIGGSAANTATNQFMIGSTLYPINQMVINGSSAYLNFGSTGGSSGYGIHDNAGTLQYKNSGGSWINIGSPSLGSYGMFVAGNGNVTALNAGSIFIGVDAGLSSTTTPYAQFIGYNAGYQATNAARSNFIGLSSGYQTTNAAESNFIGDAAGYTATNASFSNFIGAYAGFSAINASYSTLMGYNAGYENGTGIHIGSNNIIIGTNISLPNATTNAINLGGVLFGTGTYSTTSGNPSITAVSGGKIGIGVVSPSYTLDVGNSSVSGTVARFTNSSGSCLINPTSGSTGCSSDITLKKNIETIQVSVLDRILALRPVSYNWKTELDTDPTHIGFIAQEVQQVFPDVVATDVSSHTKILYMTDLVPYTIKALQEMNLKIDDLSSLDTSKATSLGSLILSFLDSQAVMMKDATIGVLHINDKICVDDVCATKEQFKALLLQAQKIK